MLCRNERKVESFRDLGVCCVVLCEERGGCVEGVEGVLCGGCLGQRGG